jgi:DNA-binding transcriptional regulator LsrR (DeoR family)
MLERALVSRFGLSEAVVVDAAKESSAILPAVGRAVALAIAPSLADGMTIGVGDGESASAVVNNLPKLWLRDVEVVPLIGGVGQLHLASHPSEIARECAGRLNGRAWQVPAPSVMPDASAADQIRQAPAVSEAFAAMRRCGLALVGIGPIDDMTSMVRHGALKLQELEAIAALGAAGMICARAYDKKGRHIWSGLDERTLAISFRDFCAIPSRWVIGTGTKKISALLASFSGSIVTAFGTDAVTARCLLDTIS